MIAGQKTQIPSKEFANSFKKIWPLADIEGNEP
jgi:hypothetical protein